MQETLKLKKSTIPKNVVNKGCRKLLAPNQYFTHCGEHTEGQEDPVLCTECGGKLRLKENHVHKTSKA